MNEEHAKFIDRLRTAAKEHGAVSDLLDIIDSSIMIDGNGNNEIVGDDDDIGFLKAAQVAAVFSKLDREQE